MKSMELAHLLLELNVLNSQEVEQELRHIAARIRHPAGQKWMMRVAKYAVINIEKIQEVPRQATDVQAHANSPDYPAYHETEAQDTGEPIPPDDTDTEYTLTEPMSLKDLASQFYGNPSLWWVIARVNDGKLNDSWFAPLPNEGAGRGKVAKRSAPDPAMNKRIFGESFESDHEHYADMPLKAGVDLRIPSKGRLANLGIFKRSGMPKQTKTRDVTPFTKQLWKGDMEANYEPLKAKKRGKSNPGDHPAEADLPEWSRGKTKELYHFNPILASRRELWVDLNHAAQYFNFILMADTEQFPELAKEKEVLFRKLETMATQDLAGFMDVLAKAREWRSDVQENPWKFTKGDPSVVFKHRNGFVWKKLETEDDLLSEGDRMSHCVGGPGYVRKLEAGQAEYYSLRDARDHPHITIEVSMHPPSIVQIKGYQDATVTIQPAYKMMAKEFVETYLRGIPVTGDRASISV